MATDVREPVCAGAGCRRVWALGLLDHRSDPRGGDDGGVGLGVIKIKLRNGG